MEIKIPEVGESVREALLAKWFKKTGDLVKRDEPICEIETDKITLDLNAEVTGVLFIAVAEGVTVPIGKVIGSITESGDMPTPQISKETVALHEQLAVAATSPSVRREMREHGIDREEIEGSGKAGRITLDDLFARIHERAKLPPVSRPAVDYAPETESKAETATSVLSDRVAPESAPEIPPAQKILTPLSPLVVSEPILNFGVKSEDGPVYTASREERHPMSPIRKRIAERLIAARQQTAMLTTFNELDMTAVKQVRSDYRTYFINKYGVDVGYMPFFVKACCEALKVYRELNAAIDGNDIVYHNTCDIGIAIGGEKGLVVPVLRAAESMRLHEIERAIKAYVEKIHANQLAITDLEGGTFSISNGGVYGSMLSTPILNPPQSGVLGMHAIKDRPVVRDGQIVIRPVMYLALSYDHRIVDGHGAVGFLGKVVELLEKPETLLSDEVVVK